MRAATHAMSDYFLNAAVTLFVTIDPVGLAPAFLAVTAGSPGARLRIAALASLIAAGVLIGASLVGEWLLDALGISLGAFRIAGGLLLFLIAVEMLFDLRRGRAAADLEPMTDAEGDNVAAFPLAIPLMAGPAALSATILIASQAPEPAAIAGVDAIIAAIIAICFGVFLLAHRIDRFLGRTARIVITRLLGLILAALSVQFVADGVTSFL